VVGMEKEPEERLWEIAFVGLVIALIVMALL
jgi:hypothetical protein